MTPFHAPGSPGAILEAKTGVFRPAPPLGSLRSVPSNAIMFGSLLAVQRFSCKSMEYIRGGKQDIFNDIFGCGIAYPYYQRFLVPTHAVIWHNRIVGSMVLLAVAYANVI